MQTLIDRVYFLVPKYAECWKGTKFDLQRQLDEGRFFVEQIEPGEYQFKDGKVGVPVKTGRRKEDPTVIHWWPVVDLVEERKLQGVYERGLKQGKKDKFRDLREMYRRGRKRGLASQVVTLNQLE